MRAFALPLLPLSIGRSKEQLMQEVRALLQSLHAMPHHCDTGISSGVEELLPGVALAAEPWAERARRELGATCAAPIVTSIPPRARQR